MKQIPLGGTTMKNVTTPAPSRNVSEELGDTLYTIPQIAKRYGVDRSTLWRWMRDQGFPKPVKLSPGCARLRGSDVLGWEAARPR